MGNSSSTKKTLEDVVERSESRSGKLAITGRYHRLPQKLEDEYNVLPKVLGSGYNGQVHLAESKTSKQKFAVKGFRLNGISNEKKEELSAEVEIFLAMDHPHVARLVDVYEGDDSLNLVMECMTGGELFKRVTKSRRFSERDAADVTFQMLLALIYIHNHGIVHRDIKLENFLYEKEDTSYLKLIDFGFSHVWKPNTKMALSCGTLAYVAPEVLDQDYTSQCDMWSFGVTVFIILFGYMPFSGSEERQIMAIKGGHYLTKKAVWDLVSGEAQDFVKKLLVLDPAKRLTAEGAMKHAWLAERDKLESGDVNQGIADALAGFGQASAFRRACMSMMAWSLTMDERAQVREAFLQLDPERNGAIKLHEFKQVMMDKFNITDEEAMYTFQSIDVNHDDEIHYTEFLAAMVTTRINLNDGLLAQTFRRFDVDNSGYITAANLREVLGESFDDVEVAKMLEEADVSHDGKISYQEWMDYLKGGGAREGHAEAAGSIVDRTMKQSGGSFYQKQKTMHLKAPAGNPTTPGGKEKKQGGCKCTVS